MTSLAADWESKERPRGVPDKELLTLLVADAARRAAAMLAGDGFGGCGPLTGEQHAEGPFTGESLTDEPLTDAIRILATPGGTRYAGRAAELTGIPEDELRQLALAHRHGGAAGVAAAVGAAEIGDADLEAAVAQVRRNRGLAVGDLTVSAGTIADPGPGVRIRFGPDGRWYPFTRARDRWWPAPGAAPSPGSAWQAALRARSRR